MAQDFASAGLDRARLASFTGGDPEVERVLLDLYTQTADGYIAKLEGAEDDQTWRFFAHALKGASANIGAVRLAELARRAENDTPDATTVRALAAELDLVRSSSSMC